MTIDPLPELVPGGTVSSALINGNFETLRLANNAVADRITALLARLKNPPVFAATIDSLHLFGKANREDGCNKLKAVELNENFAKFKASMRSIGILDKRFRDAVNGKSPTENFDILRSIEIIFEDLPAPSNLEADLVNYFGNYYISLTWTDNSDNETGFQIYQSVNGGDYTLVDTTNADAESYNVSIGSSLNEGDIYSFKIRAENDYAYSKYSNIDSLTIPEKEELPDPAPQPPPSSVFSAPSFLTITNIGSYGELNSIRLQWFDNNIGQNYPLGSYIKFSLIPPSGNAIIDHTGIDFHGVLFEYRPAQVYISPIEKVEGIYGIKIRAMARGVNGDSGWTCSDYSNTVYVYLTPLPGGDFTISEVV